MSVGRIYQRLRDPWIGGRSARKELQQHSQIFTAVLSIWLVSVGVAVWMAIGEPPWWLAGASIVVLWAVGGFAFSVLGLPPLVLPFALIWYLLPWNRSKIDDWDTEDRWEAEYEQREKLTEELKETGVLPEDYELAPKKREDFPAYLNRTALRLPPLPIRTAGIILIVALFVAGRPLLATLYTIMAVGWPLVEGLGWIAQQWWRWRGS